MAYLHGNMTANGSAKSQYHQMGIVINNVNIPDPSVLTYGLSDISQSDAGRDESGLMHPMKLTVNGQLVQKRQYQMEWNMITPTDASVILGAINASETFSATLFDPLTNSMRPGVYYVGDRSAPFQQWRSGIDGQLFTKVSFTLIEV